MYNGGLGKSVCADELIVGGMEGHSDDAHFAGDTFRTPGEIAGVEAEGAIFGVAATSADEMYTLAADSGVGWLATFLESSVDGQTIFARWWATRTSFCGSMHALHR